MAKNKLMTKEDAIKILINGFIEGYEYNETWVHTPTRTKVLVEPSHIILNLECNNYEIDMDFIQDFTCAKNGDLFQGHSLSELRKYDSRH